MFCCKDDEGNTEYIEDMSTVEPVDPSSADWNAGFEAGLRAFDIEESEAVAGQENVTTLDPDTLNPDELAFYEAGKSTGYDEGYEDGYNDALSIGYEDGLQAGARETS